MSSEKEQELLKIKIEELIMREKMLLEEKEKLERNRSRGQVDLERLEAELQMAQDVNLRQTLELQRLGVKRRLYKLTQKIENIHVERAKNLHNLMDKYSWTHAISQINFNGIAYSSIVEWAELKQIKLKNAYPHIFKRSNIQKGRNEKNILEATGIAMNIKSDNPNQRVSIKRKKMVMKFSNQLNLEKILMIMILMKEMKKIIIQDIYMEIHWK